MSFDDIEIVNNDIQEDIINYGSYITDMISLYRKLNMETAQKVLGKLNKNISAIHILKPKSQQN